MPTMPLRIAFSGVFAATDIALVFPLPLSTLALSKVSAISEINPKLRGK